MKGNAAGVYEYCSMSNNHSNPNNADLPENTLPVRAVTLFTSGVSYTLREGQIASGETTVTLAFRTAQVNDILKSLVLLDSGGQVQPVVYPSRDPLDRTLQTFAINVSYANDLVDILGQVRGATVAIETTGQESMTGRVVGVSQTTETDKDGVRTTVNHLTLFTADGLQTVPLPRVRNLRLLDERLNRELGDALALLATGTDEDRRQITLRFAGEAARTVRVGYVTESPLWKVSYRLVLEDAEDSKEGEEAKPYLQGWALVENTTEDDWQDVELSLVAGRPISFIQDLYQPLYLSRPVVPNDVIASPFPQSHEGNLEAAYDLPSPEPMAAMAMMAAPAPIMAGGGLERSARSRSAATMDRREMQESAPAQATGVAVGELFRYDIQTPVSLPRRQSAMIPIVSDTIGGEKISLYNPLRDDSRHPLNAVRVRNTSGLHLKGGPVTLFDGGVYAGDARMEDVPPGDDRLLTYALDMAIVGERQVKSSQRVSTTMTIRRGVLHLRLREQQETAYSLKSKADRPRTVLVEHMFLPDFQLVAPAKPTERTGDWYRFAVTLAPGATEELNVVQEHTLLNQMAIVQQGAHFFVDQFLPQEIPAPILAVFNEYAKRRVHLDELRRLVTNARQEVERITKEQGRIRDNIQAVGNDTALYRRYLDTLTTQENRLETLLADIDRVTAEAETAEADLRAYLDNITIE